MRKTVEERFWKYVKKTDTCWLWTGAKIPGGYGTIKIIGKTVLVHRYSYQLHFGSIPTCLDVLHTCDTPACINPSHLFVGTQADNMIDMWKKGRGADYRGEKSSSAKLNELAVREIFEDSKKGLTQRSIAIKHNVSHSVICNILNQKTWKCIK